MIAGPPEQVDAVIAVVDAQGRLARRIEVDVASHHPTVDPILPELRSALSDLAPVQPRIPLISTVGQANGRAPAFDADYWVANLREPVRFSQAVAAAAEDHATFLEVSPHPLLTYAIGDTLRATSSADGVMVTSAMKRGEDDTLFFHAQLAALGVPVANAGGAGSRMFPRRRGCIRGIGSRVVRSRGSRRILTRCLGCTLSCRRAATMSGRQISERRRCRRWPVTR